MEVAHAATASAVTLDEFAKITKAVISNSGFEEFHPTAIYPGRGHVTTLVGLPPDLPTEVAVLRWAAESAENQEEFLVAFKIGDNHFKVIRRISSYSEDEVYAVDRF